MKTNLQTNGEITGLPGKPYDFYKQIDINDLHKYLIEKYHEHTGNSYRNYFERYASVFFGPNPDVELFKLKPHKRSWILQSIKRFDDYYFRKYNNSKSVSIVQNTCNINVLKLAKALSPYLVTGVTIITRVSLHHQNTLSLLHMLSFILHSCI